MTDKAVWGGGIYQQGGQPVPQWEYDELFREAAFCLNDAARAAGHIIRSCDSGQHYDWQGEEVGCSKHKIPVPCYAAVECDDFEKSIYLPDEQADRRKPSHLQQKYLRGGKIQKTQIT